MQKKFGFLGFALAAAAALAMVSPAVASDDEIDIHSDAYVVAVGQVGVAGAFGKPKAVADVSNQAAISAVDVSVDSVDFDDIYVDTHSGALGVVQLGASVALADSCGGSCTGRATAEVSNLAGVSQTDIRLKDVDVDTVDVDSSSFAAGVLQGGLSIAGANGNAFASVTNGAGISSVGVDIDD